MLGHDNRGRRRIDRIRPTDRRSSQRNRVLFSGKIVYGSGSALTADCAIRDLSPTGACVVLPEHQAAPATFHLIVVRDAVAHQVRTTWTRHPHVGVAFEASYPLTAGETPAHLLGLRALWGGLAPRA